MRAGLRKKHKWELEKLTITSQPLKTMKFFTLAILQHINRSLIYIFTHGCLLMIFIAAIVAIGVFLVTDDSPHKKHVEELIEYLRFVLWWVALGVASSIGLGSGLHTFVLYLGPHIALFTMKAMQCGRVDIKSAPYDTTSLNRSPTWLNKNCSEFGPPLVSSTQSPEVTLSSILAQVQVESILWGFGTAIGELPPYFISRAASISGGKADELEEFNTSAGGPNGRSSNMDKLKRWFLSHAQYLNFFTILLLASVPNPLFDLAGIMCGQFEIPFWEFFLATVIGKAIIKSHIQTVFVISLCNNQLLNWIETELIWTLSIIPGVSSVLPKIVAKVHGLKNKYMTTTPPNSSNIKSKSWDFSLATVWNSIIWLMLLNFFSTIITSTAQSYLKNEQEKEMAVMKKKLLQTNETN
ncbi:vacuole membrane protein KMS1-like [Rutidosis leptorrhynchoides]|uniref:vacuole membrane protein KMS1-like n=1 Tax=Rutidosis leptorrhynchoides TaxID=125765 RepID=UPI003A9973D3